jgi:Spy/CpxP family protein refolding chaperone
MKNVRLGLTVVVVLLSGVALAQRPKNEDVSRDPQGWRQARVDFLGRHLSLTDSQKQQVTNIFNAADDARKELRKSLEKAQEELSNAVKTGASDQQVEKLAGTVGTLVGQLAANDGKERTKLRAILTAEQRQKFDEAPGPRAGMMMHGFAGGPPGGPGMGMMHGFAAGPPGGPGMGMMPGCAGGPPPPGGPGMGMMPGFTGGPPPEPPPSSEEARE